MENNDEEVKEVLNQSDSDKDEQTQLRNDEKSSSKTENDNNQKNSKFYFGIALYIFFAVLLATGFIILALIYKNKNDSCIENKTNNLYQNSSNNSYYNTPSVDKPIIYLYPTEETQVNVQLGNKEQITCSYPKYTTGWNVIAQPNGDLKDIDTNKNLYSLYYESDNVVKFKVEKDGFIVKGEDSAEFLEEKLKILGLTDREVEEFIIYWLPKLESNKYNYIRFATREEIDANMPLIITPTPDTTIRVLMEYKRLENSIEVEEQKLESVERKGFIAVEWGGTEIK